jgi:hypothetical protein
VFNCKISLFVYFKAKKLQSIFKLFFLIYLQYIVLQLFSQCSSHREPNLDKSKRWKQYRGKIEFNLFFKFEVKIISSIIRSSKNIRKKCTRKFFSRAPLFFYIISLWYPMCGFVWIYFYKGGNYTRHLENVSARQNRWGSSKRLFKKMNPPS